MMYNSLMVYMEFTGLTMIPVIIIRLLEVWKDTLKIKV